MSIDLQLSRALHYGHGCFTTLIYRDRAPLLWAYHWQRLQQAIALLGLDGEESCVREQLQQAINEQADSSGILKVMLLAESSANGYAPPKKMHTQVLILPRPLCHQLMAMKREHGCYLMRCQHRLAHQPVLAGIKHLNRLEQVLASRELNIAETIHSDDYPNSEPVAYDDGVMLDFNDQVIETTCANLFIRIGSQWMTPDLSVAGVAGVARARIIHEFEHAKELLDIRPICWAEFCLADEIFICNAVRGIWPVVRLQQKKLPIGHWTRYLQTKLQLCFFEPIRCQLKDS